MEEIDCSDSVIVVSDIKEEDSEEVLLILKIIYVFSRILNFLLSIFFGMYNMCFFLFFLMNMVN